MKLITADYIFDGSAISEQTGIVLDQDNKIIEIIADGQFDKSKFTYFPGLLTPGFVNAHCHLELSHLKDKFNTGTGLIAFLYSVVSQRAFPQNIIDDAIIWADSLMYRNGIVAVGDISNKTDTIQTKKNSKIEYYNFIECFDFHQEDKYKYFLEPYLKVHEAFGTLKKSLSPHAPYTVSANLFAEINHRNRDFEILSIHNQETTDEDALFLNKSGKLEEFFQKFGFDLNNFKPIQNTSIHYTMSKLSEQFQLLLVHNTMMKKQDIESAIQWNKNIYFVTCPNANLFIENRLPNYKEFINSNATLCIGTDSLSSNWTLCILEEIKTILKYQSFLSLEEVLQWATLNGAKALGMSDRFGTFKPGMKPGINLISNIKPHHHTITISESSRVTKLY